MAMRHPWNGPPHTMMGFIPTAGTIPPQTMISQCLMQQPSACGIPTKGAVTLRCITGEQVPICTPEMLASLIALVMSTTHGLGVSDAGTTKSIMLNKDPQVARDELEQQQRGLPHDHRFPGMKEKGSCPATSDVHYYGKNTGVRKTRAPCPPLPDCLHCEDITGVGRVRGEHRASSAGYTSSPANGKG